MSAIQMRAERVRLISTSTTRQTTSGAADDVVDDLGLEKNGANQDARHILFLTLDSRPATDATPTVEIDSNDLIDLAGNDNRSDHRSHRRGPAGALV